MMGIVKRGASLVVWGAIGLVVGFTIGRVGLETARAQTCPVDGFNSFSNGPDSIQDTDDGVNEDNRWKMLGGRDFGRSLACNDARTTDRFEGNGENDDIGGGSGGDVLDGGANNDTMFGGADTTFPGDNISGNTGADTISDVETNDLDNLLGGDGPDTLNADDNDPNDLVQGQAGSDNCFVDPGDTVSSCP